MFDKRVDLADVHEGGIYFRVARRRKSRLTGLWGLSAIRSWASAVGDVRQVARTAASVSVQSMTSR